MFPPIIYHQRRPEACVPFNFKSSWCASIFLMAYSKAPFTTTTTTATTTTAAAATATTYYYYYYYYYYYSADVILCLIKRRAL